MLSRIEIEGVVDRRMRITLGQQAAQRGQMRDAVERMGPAEERRRPQP